MDFTGTASEGRALEAWGYEWLYPSFEYDRATSSTFIVHLLLDALGFTPIVGPIFDGLNAYLYLAEGRGADAVLSAVSAIPLGGDAFAGVRSVKYIDETSEFGSKAFRTFDAFKAQFGAAPRGTQWHHVVEQSQEWRFGSRAIHHVDNVVLVSDELHWRISGFYSSKQWWTGGLTVREWTRTMSYEEQHRYGLDMLRWFSAFMSTP